MEYYFEDQRGNAVGEESMWELASSVSELVSRRR